LLLREVVPDFRDSSGGGVAVVNHDAIAEAQLLAGFERDAVFLGFRIDESLPAEWIRREQTIAAHVPVGAFRIGGMIENCDADSGPVARIAVVIHPIGAF